MTVKLLLRITLIFSLGSWNAISALSQPTFVRYVCSETASSAFSNTSILAPSSEAWCEASAKTQIITEVSGATNIATVTSVRSNNGPHSVSVNVQWVQNATGVIVVKISYKRNVKKSGINPKCVWQAPVHMYTYEIHKGEDVSPGIIIGENDIATASSNEATTNFNLTYVPSVLHFNQNTELRIEKIKYNTGIQDEQSPDIPVTRVGLIHQPVSLTYFATGIRTHVLQVWAYCTIEGACGRWYELTPKNLYVYSSCYKDDVSDVNIGVNGIEENADGSVKVTSETSYTLSVTGITDFANNFHWVANGGEDLTLNGNNFTVHNTTGSFRIEAIPNGEGCPVPAPLLVFTGGENEVIEEDCSIVVPPYFAQEPYNYAPDNIIFSHFATHLESKRSIVVMPGVTLDFGAELSLEVVPGEDNSSDLVKNFIEQSTYDEYGRLLSESRAYFDDDGRILQNQTKNIADGVILANATIYDAYGRAAISTLSAPVVADPSKNCESDDRDGHEMLFRYLPDFVQANDGSPYSYQHFDLENEEQPDPLGIAEGTLGWYYSAANGSSPNSLLHEPFVATSQYPYSRHLFHHDGTENLRGVTSPGDVFKGGVQHLATTRTEAVEQNDIYFASNDIRSYLKMRHDVFNLAAPASIEGLFFKTINVDGAGKKSVAYTDLAGQTIISLFYGTEQQPITTSFTFYDLTGKVLATISPNGFNQYVQGVSFDKIDKTRYYYDNKNRLAATEEMIAGQAADGISRTEFMYAKDGRIRFSQNEAQRNISNKCYSYTNYDDALRPIESGEFVGDVIAFAFNSTELIGDLELTNSSANLANGEKRHQSFSYFDEDPGDVPLGRVPRFLHGAVAKTKNDLTTTWYSYDERGRVEWMIQNIEGLGDKTIDYRYGPTGQVQEVTYQRADAADRFTHFYEYDKNGRLEKVYTTRALLTYDINGRIKDAGVTYTASGSIASPGVLTRQAIYSYYLHGPLKRVELAPGYKGNQESRLQGIDYVYTINGMLKSINSANPNNDPGNDTANENVRDDVFGISLDYFSGDYLAANGNSDNVVATATNQYTGLIKSTRWHSPISSATQFAYAYEYDQRNQLSVANWGTINAGIFMGAGNSYKEAIGGYDPNGNIVSLERKANLLGTTPRINYNLNYNYKALPNTSATLNLLQSVTDSETSANSRQYEYNDIGQLTSETQNGNSKYIKYDASGKILDVFSDQTQTTNIVNFNYDDRGFRLSKTTYAEGEPKLRTWYVRDASGSVMATYEQLFEKPEGQENTIALAPELTELPVYASGRLGMYRPQANHTLYELNDHLGNVRAVIGKEFPVEFMATMETERVGKENEDFTGLGNHASAYNSTPQTFELDGGPVTLQEQSNKVLRMNNLPINGTPTSRIGTGISRWVHPGDDIHATVQVKYADFVPDNEPPLPLLASLLATTFTSTALIDAPSFFSPVESPSFANFACWQELDDDEPQAFLNILFFDREGNLEYYDFDQVSSDAKITGLSEHEELTLDYKPTKEGFLYIFLSNHTNQNTEVYFDDLFVRHTYSDVVAGADYYPFGLAIEDRQISRDYYRRGYQGQFSEKDEETGWNHFELREYDPVIGRWNAIDPAGQFWSPYVGMGNNPVSLFDSDGGYSQAGAVWRWGVMKSLGFDPSDIYQAGDGKYDYGFNTSFGGHFGPVGGTSYVSDAWNSNFARGIIPDYITFSVSENMSMYGGAEVEETLTLMLRGRDPGLYYTTSMSLSVTTGTGPSIGLSSGKGYFFGMDPRNFSSEVLPGSGFGAQLGVPIRQIPGSSAGLGLSFSLTDDNQISTIETKGYFSIGSDFYSSPIDATLNFIVTSKPHAIFKF